MCGIVAYTGKNEASKLLLDGLKALEYRGYDSAGIYLTGAGVRRVVGSVSGLYEKLEDQTWRGHSGIAHTRWATHGSPNEKNAHPHGDCQKNVWLVHNGIVENYQSLKKGLIERGHAFASETDSEVLVHLVEEEIEKGAKLEDAVLKTLEQVRGTYGIAVVSEKEPGKVVAARLGSPIVIGLADDGAIVASDASPVIRHTRQVIYLNDGEMAVLTPEDHRLFTLDRKPVTRPSEELDWDVSQAEKEGYPHFMLKEINETPQVVRAASQGRIVKDEGGVKLGGLESHKDLLRDIDRLIIVGCGTAYYAGLVGEYMLEEYAGIPVEVEVASEFRYRKPILSPKTAIFGISQSGETADTLAAIREAKQKGALALGIVNTVGSTIARETDAGVYNHAGPEIGVASTKAFISQLTVLSLFSVFLGRMRQMSLTMGKRIGEELTTLPSKMEEVLKQSDAIRELATKYKDYNDFLYIGRKYNLPMAYEGALKLKEVSYIHAEGYGAGEMKHGPLAMIDENFPTVAIALKDSVYEKMTSNMQEIKARGGPIIALASEGDEEIKKIANDVVYLPKTLEMLSPILTALPLQLFAYHIASLKGYNVDKPRNLAKSVTVE